MSRILLAIVARLLAMRTGELLFWGLAYAMALELINGGTHTLR